MIIFMLIAIMSNKNQPLKYLVDNGTLFWIFFYIKFLYRYNIEVDEEQIYIQRFAWGLLVVLSAGCGLAAWMH